MMARRGVLGLFAGTGTLAITGCGLLGGNSYRFRMTVEADTPQGLRTGSSVYEVSAHRSLKLTAHESSVGGGLKGEALPLDTPNGPIFVLLTLPDAKGPLGNAATVALAPEARSTDPADYLAAVSRLGGWFDSASAELPRESWPLMVRFRDLGDPTSVERVEPEAVGIRRIVVETTGDAVTTGIERRLGWLTRSLKGMDFQAEGIPLGNFRRLFSTKFGR